MQLFAQMMKVDEAARTVTGVIASEALDRSGEVFDYDTSKPHFASWSGDIAKATGGKSVGNVRALHGNVCAGKLTDLSMDDAAKSITVTAHIIDEGEWKKVASGCYGGFSIGGSYLKKWETDGVRRYTAKPAEVSIVDLPCNPDATFTMVKADGSEELRKFHTTVAESESLAKWAGSLNDEQRGAVVDHLANLAKATQLSEEDAMNDELQKKYDAAAAELAKVAGERDDLQKRFDAMTADLAERDALIIKAAADVEANQALAKSLEDALGKLKALPEPVKAVAMVVEKSADTSAPNPATELRKQIDSLPDGEDKVKASILLAFQTPM